MSRMFSSQVFSVQKAVVAAVLTVAAAPFAVSGEVPAWLMRSAAAVAMPAPAGDQADPARTHLVARAGKSDRAAVVPAGVASRTFSIQPIGIADMSVLVRIVSPRPASPAIGKPATRVEPPRKTVWPRAACEPVVSMLTEVAKQLAPGRCIT
ncbi:MAG: hypothetical protein M9932_08815 [Xanthobacteraceae bacterium]|nr:hypothetical protein [Xanthobacteraceae bacterium]